MLARYYRIVKPPKATDETSADSETGKGNVPPIVSSGYMYQLFILTNIQDGSVFQRPLGTNTDFIMV